MLLHFIVGCVSLQEMMPSGGGDRVDTVTLTIDWLKRICELLKLKPENVHQGELAAFLSFAMAYPQNFLPVIDTYSVKRYFLFLKLKGVCSLLSQGIDSTKSSHVGNT